MLITRHDQNSANSKGYHEYDPNLGNNIIMITDPIHFWQQITVTEWLQQQRRLFSPLSLCWLCLRQVPGTRITASS